MDNLFTSEPSLIGFDLIYKQNITPKLQAIDLFLKTTDAPYSALDVAQCLHMSFEQIMHIMKESHITNITRLDFFTIVSKSSSHICLLIQRQWQYAYQKLYSPQMIAYIYELNINKVIAAFKEFEKEYIHEDDLLNLFSYILVPIFQFSNV